MYKLKVIFKIGYGGSNLEDDLCCGSFEDAVEKGKLAFKDGYAYPEYYHGDICVLQMVPAEQISRAEVHEICDKCIAEFRFFRKITVIIMGEPKDYCENCAKELENEV